VRVRVPPGLAELLAEDSSLLADAEEALSVRVELQVDETAAPGTFEILRG
jgi:hypothetical protein